MLMPPVMTSKNALYEENVDIRGVNRECKKEMQFDGTYGNGNPFSGTAYRLMKMRKNISQRQNEENIYQTLYS